MKKILFTIIFLVVNTALLFGQKFLTRTGKIYFSAIVPKTPEVEAINNEAASILDPKTGQIVCQVPIKSFKFKRELMQEHFNENYMESDKYPRSEFQGKVSDPGGINFNKDGNYNTAVTGNLSIHGITHEITVPGTILIKGNTAEIKAEFVVKLKDYNITIPTIVADKVAQEATIKLDFELTKQ